MAKLPALARIHPEIERRIHAALESARESREAEKRGQRDYVPMSTLGGCPRDLWGAHKGVPEERPPAGQALIAFALGHAVEGVVIDMLRSAGYEVVDRCEDGNQIGLTMPGGIGLGYIDGMIRWGRGADLDWRLLEVKSAKAKRFDELLAAGSYAQWNAGYEDQVHAYMGASHEDPEAPTALSQTLVIVMCKDDSRIHAEMIALDWKRYEDLKSRAQVALGDVLPERPGLATSRYCKFCKWCSRGEWCWEGMAGVEFDD